MFLSSEPSCKHNHETHTHMLGASTRQRCKEIRNAILRCKHRKKKDVEHCYNCVLHTAILLRHSSTYKKLFHANLIRPHCNHIIYECLKMHLMDTCLGKNSSPSLLSKIISSIIKYKHRIASPIPRTCSLRG